jgi:hypothetical protein
MIHGIENNKNEYRSKKIYKRQHDAAAVQTAETPENLPQSSRISENQRKYRGH